MKIDNQLHKRLIQELKKYYKPTAVYPKDKKEIENFAKKDIKWKMVIYRDLGLPIKPLISASPYKKVSDYIMDQAIYFAEGFFREIALLKKFEKELDPLILVELAELNFRHFTEKYYIYMISALRHIILIKRRRIAYKSIVIQNRDLPLANYAKKIVGKMLNVAIPKLKKGRKPRSLDDMIECFRFYKRKVKIYRQIKKEITKTEYRNWQVFKSMLKKKYNVCDEELNNLRDYKPSEIAIEITAEDMNKSIPWVKQQIRLGIRLEHMARAFALETYMPPELKEAWKRFEI